jgi:hypothetical protein
MILPTPRGELYLADSIRDLSARRYLLFNQAWARELGVGTDLYATDGHFAKMRLFLSKNDAANALVEYNNTLLALTNLTSEVPVHYQCAVLAPLATRYSDDLSEAGLEKTAQYLAEVLTQQQVSEAAEHSKKNFRPN